MLRCHTRLPAASAPLTGIVLPQLVVLSDEQGTEGRAIQAAAHREMEAVTL